VAEPAADGRGRLWLRRAGYFLGIALLLGAIAMVWRQRSTIAAALEAVERPDPIAIAMLAGSVAANVVLSAVFIRLLISRYGRVGMLEMNAVVAAASLANFLPLRPGMFGRIAYHKAVNGIAARDTVKTIIQSLVISLAIAVGLCGVMLLTHEIGRGLVVGVTTPVVLLAAATAIRPARLAATATLVRYLEVLVWAVRYHAAFTLIGAPIEPDVAVAFACVSVVATMVPFVGNGLGIREWAVGLLAPVLTGYQLELGVGAELINRAAELIVITGLGIAGMAWLRRRARG